MSDGPSVPSGAPPIVPESGAQSGPYPLDTTSTMPEGQIPGQQGTEPSVSEAPPESAPPPVPEPAPPFWASRRYLPRSFGFMHNGVFIQGNYRQLPDGQVDIDGLYGTTEYQSTNDLVKLAAPSHQEAQALVTKVREVLAHR